MVLKNRCSLTCTKGEELMGKQLVNKCDELKEKMRKYDEAILELIKQGHSEIIVNVIKDYLSLHE